MKIDKKLKLLDLYCGGGGAAYGYMKAGFDVTGIDIEFMFRYPGCKFIQADALQYLKEHGNEYDVIHASPPCQKWSNLNNIHKIKDYPDLIESTRDELIKLGKPWIMENIMTAPIYGDMILCGTRFGLKIRRHRRFEFSKDIRDRLPAQVNWKLLCNHTDDDYDPYHGKRSIERYKEVMEIDWLPQGGGTNKKGSIDEAIPPAYTEYVGKLVRSLL